MKRHLQHSQATYRPQQYKNFAGALGAFFQQECPQLGGTRTRKVLVQCVIELVNQFYPQTTHMRQGQIHWTTIHKEEKASYGKSVANSRLTSVILDLVQPHDAEERANKKKLRDIKIEATGRLFQQAYEQDGCLTNAEVAIMLKCAAPTVSKYIREWEHQHDQQLPRRGTIHDMGPTLTHKKMIIQKLFLEGKSVETVCRETYHSPEAVHRYLCNFKQVLLCHRRRLDEKEIAFAVKMSARLVKEYLELIDELRQKNLKLDQMLQNLENYEK